MAVNLEPVFGSIDGYAPQIDAAVQQLTETTGLPPLLVCHSMGGLAARAWLKRMNAESRVHHVVTIGTPHRGTSFADWGVGRFERIARPLMEMIGIPSQAFYDLTRANCKTFNENVLDARERAIREEQEAVAREFASHPDFAQARDDAALWDSTLLDGLGVASGAPPQ